MKVHPLLQWKKIPFILILQVEFFFYFVFCKFNLHNLLWERTMKIVRMEKYICRRWNVLWKWEGKKKEKAKSIELHNFCTAWSFKGDKNRKEEVWEKSTEQKNTTFIYDSRKRLRKAFDKLKDRLKKYFSNLTTTFFICDEFSYCVQFVIITCLCCWEGRNK